MIETASEPLLEVRRVTKRFPGVRALHEVDLCVRQGEVVAVIGENGAGKSTLMTILAGVQRPDEGDLIWQGKPVDVDSVHTALELGISLIHQELNLADNLDVASNIFLGREPRRFGLIQYSRIHRDAKKYLDLIGMDVATDAPLDSLTIGRQQMVEIAKALSVDARVLIMDEPTSSLSAPEAEALFRVVRQLSDQGVAIIYISHRLGEVDRLAHRVVVLRDGENVGELCGDAINRDAMVRMMVGRDVSQFYARTRHEPGDVVLEVRDLVTTTYPRHRLNFQVRAGEIVGVAGLVGAGRTELLRTLFGVEPRVSGQLLIDDRPRNPKNCFDAIGCGMALVPEDRKLQGLIVEMSVRANISLAGLSFNRRLGVFLNRTAEDRDTQAMIERLRIRTPDPSQVVQYLSGGNQQKVVLAKWLTLRPRVLLLDEPTRGIDVGAKEEIYMLMEELARSGVAILFVSSEMEELIGMSDRALVMHEGRMTGELRSDALSEEAIMRLATGSEAISS